MSNSYSMEYGYASLIYPARMFKTREDAQRFDAVESRSALLGASFTRARIEAIANGTVPDEDGENCRVIFAALRWTVNAAEDAESEKRIAEWYARNAKATIIAAEDECETGVALTQAINEVLAEDAQSGAAKIAAE